MITPGQLGHFGSDLHRPECVLTTRKGVLHVSDSRGGVLTLHPDGRVRALLREGLVANGIALLEDGSFLVANMGAEGGVWRLAEAAGGTDCRPWLTECGGRSLDSVNFVLLDHQGRVWITLADREARAGRYSSDGASGAILLVDARGARIVADGLCWTNECRVTRDGATLYVNETFGRRTTAFDISLSGDLSGRRTAAEFGEGIFPDGLALDAEGGLWIASVISNRILRVSADGSQQLLLDDPDPRLDAFERDHRAHALTRAALSTARGSRLRNLSSLAFGGPDLRTVYLGSLAGTRLETLRAPVAGESMAHWYW